MFDEDGGVDGFFTFHGYTNRYGDIVEGCEVIALDCIPLRSEHFPVGKSEFRGGVQDTVEYDIEVFDASGNRYFFIRHPN